MVNSLKTALHFTLCLTFVVILLGAYTRLKDAGLGCPDWPGCYGNLLAPKVSSSFDAVAVFKAWVEMVHRYIASFLGVLVIFITVQSLRHRRRWPQLWIFACVLLALVILQGLLGMWTVTMRLNPLVVMGHLMGGICIISLLWWMCLKSRNITQVGNNSLLRMCTYVCLATLICQIALGGWTSANYAALVCADFPSCQGSLWPAMDWQNAFAMPGTPLENSARVTIQMAHRLGALIVCLEGIALMIYLVFQSPILRKLGVILGTLLGAQVILGISNVVFGLPLLVSLAHNAVAVLLLLCLITILYINAKEQHS